MIRKNDRETLVIYILLAFSNLLLLIEPTESNDPYIIITNQYSTMSFCKDFTTKIRASFYLKIKYNTKRNAYRQIINRKIEPKLLMIF